MLVFITASARLFYQLRRQKRRKKSKETREALLEPTRFIDGRLEHVRKVVGLGPNETARIGRYTLITQRSSAGSSDTWIFILVLHARRSSRSARVSLEDDLTFDVSSHDDETKRKHYPDTHAHGGRQSRASSTRSTHNPRKNERSTCQKAKICFGLNARG